MSQIARLLFQNKTWNVGSFANLKYLSVGFCVAKLFSVLSNANNFRCPGIQYGCRAKPVFIQTARDFLSNSFDYVK